MTSIDTSPDTSGRYRIAEMARLSGFTPATLRYYEQAGVLAEPERTPSGYRLYSDRDLERLRLIARAKDLGCTLEEITELVEAWEDDDCGPVRHRLRSLVHQKVLAVQAHLAEQVSLAVQLQATEAALADRPVDGPCDESCGCTTAPAAAMTAGDGAATTGAVATELGAIEVVATGDEDAHGCGPNCGCGTDGTAAPVLLGPSSEPDDSDVSIACSLSADAVGTRIEDWQAVLDFVRRREGLPGGLRLELGDDAPLDEVVRLSAAEQACCPFFGFAITIDHRGVAFEVTAPEDGQDVLTAAFGAAA